MASYNFGLGPAIIVLVIPSNVQPVRFFDERDAGFELKASVGEAPKQVDAQIKDNNRTTIPV